MEKIDAILARLGIDFAALVAGLLGGAVAVYRSDRKLTLWESFGLIFVGAVCAAYFTDPLTRWMNIGDGVRNALSFCVGIAGLQLAGAVLRIGRKIEKNPVKTFTELKTGVDHDDNNNEEADGKAE